MIIYRNNYTMNMGNEKTIRFRFLMLNGKVAVVTGSTAGIGFAIAKRLGLDGAKVVLSSRKQTNVDKALDDLRNAGITADGTVCHVGKQKDRDNLVNFAMQKYGRIDILVNNAGINPHFGSLLEVSEEIWDKLFDTNVKAGFLLSKQVVPIMEKQGGGNIIYVSSITGYVPFQGYLMVIKSSGFILLQTQQYGVCYHRFFHQILLEAVTSKRAMQTPYCHVCNKGIAAYGVTKTALLGLVKALAISCSRMNIRVNGIAPGVIKTDFSKALWESDATSNFYQETVPLGRLGNPDDCSGAVSFLCSDQAAYITGEVIMITGGINARL